MKQYFHKQQYLCQVLDFSSFKQLQSYIPFNHILIHLVVILFDFSLIDDNVKQYTNWSIYIEIPKKTPTLMHIPNHPHIHMQYKQKTTHTHTHIHIYIHTYPPVYSQTYTGIKTHNIY